MGENKSRDMVSSSTGNFCYSTDVSPGFVSDSEMFNLTSGMDMIGFSKNLHLHHQQQQQEENHLIQDSSSPWQNNSRFLVDDSSLRCVFPCEGNERPSQGLSLSLSSTNPSSIGLQPFELRHTNQHHHHHQQQMLQDANIYHQHGDFVLKHSKFLVPAQDLLNELCSLGTKKNDIPKSEKSEKNKEWEEGSSKKHCLGSLEFVELQKRKTKLFSMLEEVERRHRHYCNQMKAVVSSFEAVAGNGAATVYSALALKQMSKHFRCLKDGILEQIHATRKLLGEKDPISPGTTKGETPRLRIIEQTLRQQRAFQQMNMMETHPWRPQRGLPERSVSVLRAWLFEHFLHPYPSDVDKHILARQTGLSRSQVSNWFINARVRLWKPMVEEMYLEEEKEREQNMVASSEGAGNNNIHEEEDMNHDVQNLSPSTRPDQKPTTQARRLLRIDSDCMSSIINNPDHDQNDTKTHHHMNPHEQFESGVDLDFSSYATHHSPSMQVSYTSAGNNVNPGFRGGGGVSLTLGLQQHGGSGVVSLAFPPPQATQGSMYYTRDQVDQECPTGQFSLLDGEGQNMPYRNLMGTQLLHDFA